MNYFPAFCPRHPALLLFAMLLVGCGGGGSSPSGGGSTTPQTKGIATVSVVWPARGRFVPLASNSVVVALSSNGAAVARKTLARPTDGSTSSTATFDGLAYGNYLVNLATFPSADGTGTAQATGAASLKVTEDATAQANVSLVTTVASLAVLPVAFDKNQTATVTVGATDAQGNTVLLAVGDATEAVAWSADKVQNTLGAMVDAVAFSSQTGTSVVLTGLHSGTTQVHATLGLGLATPLVGSGTVSINAIADGTATVTFS